MSETENGSTNWEALCREKKLSQENSIPPQWKLVSPPQDDVLDVRKIPLAQLTSQESEITDLDDVGQLLGRLATGEWTAVAVTTAYMKRALIAHQLVNCLTEFWPIEAIERARELDEIFKVSGPVGELHGLPVSLKDQFQVKGKECNMGFASWLGHISDDDAALVKILRAAGAVIYTRTNVPQTLMKTETSNHVYGVTVNPFNRTLTPGGSSGGEGALLAMKGSPIGVGTDNLIGGSIRVPAAFCGLYGLRPTTRRVPYGGALNTLVGLETIESSAGPLARSLKSCAVFMKVIANGKPGDVDPKVVDMPWRENVYQLEHLGPHPRLCFAWYDDDGVVHPSPPVRRAVALTIDKLKAEGHQVIAWKPEEHESMIDTAYRIFSAGAMDDFAEIWKDSGETPILGIDVTPRTPITVHQSWKLAQKRDHFRAMFLKKWLATVGQTTTGRPIDGLICPVAPSPATPLEKNSYPGYTIVYNLLDVPSIVLPVTTVDPELDVPDEGVIPRNGQDASYYAFYSPDALRNAPVAIQIVGRRWGEEELLAIGEVVDKAVKR